MGPTGAVEVHAPGSVRPAPLVEAAARAEPLPMLTRPGLMATLAPMVDIVIPVHDGRDALVGCVESLYDFLARAFPLPWRVTIVDTGSTDGSWEAACRLVRRYPGVTAWRLPACGHGAALREEWLSSPAEIVAYLDLDLAGSLEALLPMIAPLVSGHCDLSVGSRLAPGALVHRRRRHEALTWGYNRLLRLAFGTRYTDARCAFKAARSEMVRPLLRVVTDDGRFFDTELLIAAAHNGLRVHEVPVDTVDGRTRPAVAMTALTDLRGMLRVGWARIRGRLRVTLPARREPLPVEPDAVLTPTRAQRATHRVRRPLPG